MEGVSQLTEGVTGESGMVVLDYPDGVLEDPVGGEANVLLVKSLPHHPQVKGGVVGDKQDDLTFI